MESPKPNKQDGNGEVVLLDTVANKSPRFSLLEEDKLNRSPDPMDSSFQPSGSSAGFYGVAKAYENSASFVASPRESSEVLTEVKSKSEGKDDEYKDLEFQEINFPNELTASVKDTIYRPGETDKRRLLARKDPFGETFEEQCKRMRETSPYGNLKTWRLAKIIVKKGCDLRQEQFAMQLISQFDQIFKAVKLNIWLKPYEIVCTGPNCGLVECVSNAISLDALNQKLLKLDIHGLGEFFQLYYPSEKRIRWVL